ENTLFVMDADKMGLSQLYQLRGRVGRSTRLGYAYFTFQKDKILTEIAQKRLMTLSEFTQFGAGFQIAMRDLEIRGAGSLLGAEQSGHIADVGYEYYCKLMQSAISEAKGEAQPLTVETVLDIPLDAHIPKDYIASEVQRLGMYRRIAMITDRASLYDVQEEMEDRYGNIPQPVQNLMDAALVKALAGKAQAMQLTVREGSAKLQFHEQAEIDGIRLVAAAANTGAQIIQGDTVSLAWRLGNKSPGEILAVLPALLSEIATCAEAGE
ncbi:MAG: transcription-repair coupling factor, partial [Eubacteriales bacterium]|nr:transcription-repair coupling factor [Eubacteriales bacterium]